MRIAIIGCGLIGKKRARALGGHELVAAADADLNQAREVARLAQAPQAQVATDWKIVAGHPQADVVVVSTPNHLLTPIGLYALGQQKHVLLEKPGARSAAEILELKQQAKTSKQKVKVGFNLRYHPALAQAKQILDAGGLGELMFIRGRYGHGGRLGYEQEWRAQPEISGGGELIDQGVHLLDLSRWFLGELQVAFGFPHTYFWNMPVDDNCFMALQAAGGQMAWLHVSCSEWKNMFCLEIYGRTGKLQIDGLGGSYKTERLTHYKMSPKMGPPETEVWEFPGEDASWSLEWQAFCAAIEKPGPVCGDVDDAWAALNLVDQIYGRDQDKPV